MPDPPRARRWPVTLRAGGGDLTSTQPTPQDAPAPPRSGAPSNRNHAHGQARASPPVGAITGMHQRIRV